MSKSTKKLLSVLTAAAITVSTFTVVLADEGTAELTATYDAGTNVVTVTNIPNTGNVQNIMIAAGTEAVDDVTTANIKAWKQVDNSITVATTQNISVASLADGTYTVHVGGSNATYASTTFTVGSVSADALTASYNKAAKTITVNNLEVPTAGTDANQTLKVTNSANREVAIAEYPANGPMATTQTITLADALADGTYTVTAGGTGLTAKTCTFTVASMSATYDATAGTVTISNITVSGVGQNLRIVNASNSEVGMEEYPDSQSTRVVNVFTLADGTYTVYVYTDGVLETCTFTVGSGSGNNNNNNGNDSGNGGSSSVGGRPTGTVVNTSSVNFTDLDSVPWAKTAITVLATQGIVNGRTDTTFDPNGNITRAEFAKLACLALNINVDSNPTQVFTDVTSSHWAYKYVSAAAKNGIINGVSDTEFDPEGLVTREQMATMLYRAINASAMKDKLNVSTGRAFADADQISSWATEAVKVLSGAGIINGVSDTQFVPAGSATRAQAACIIYQCFQALALV